MTSRDDAWAASGAMWLTGRAEGPPLPVAGDPAGQVAEQLTELARLTGASLPDVRVLGEREALTGMRRSGAVSVGGASRILPARDGWVAVSLARPDDVDAVPALVGHGVGDPWQAVAAFAAAAPALEFVARARLLDLAASVVPDAAPVPRRPAVLVSPGAPRPHQERPRVVDLSSLWAGPLCAHLLGLAGADVIKVESLQRVDGARRGSRDFFDLLHAGHRCVALDFSTAQGRADLAALIDSADVVVEASRPRALRRLGVDAGQAAARGAVWISITAYGRDGDNGDLVGFGDDVAAGAGLVARDPDGPVFAGDALADPLAGVQAALAGATALAAGRGALLDVSMHDTSRTAAARRAPVPAGQPPARPVPRRAASVAAAPGEDTDAVLATLASRNG